MQATVHPRAYRFKPLAVATPPSSTPTSSHMSAQNQTVPRTFKRIAVYCGSSQGNETYMECARAMGRELARRNIGLVYGGGNVGLMGAVAEAVAANHPDGAKAVLGVIPESLVSREVSGETVGEIRVVKTMHLRKAEMAEHADGFIALPGGFGTMEELFETITWLQLGFHTKPVALLNVNGFYDKLVEFMDVCVQSGFVRQQTRDTVLYDSDPAALLDKMSMFVAPRSVIELAKNGELDIRTRG